MKRFIAIIVCLSLLLACVPTATAAEAKDWDRIRGAYDRIVDGILAFEEEIDIVEFELTYDEFVYDIYYNITFNEPMVLHLDTMYYTYDSTTGDILAANPTYDMTREEYNTRAEYVNKEIDAIVGSLPAGLDEYETALYFHDYIVANFAYDPDVAIRDIYTMLQTGYGVCHGYTLLYDELLTRVGIDSYGVLAESINHIWNAVKLGGEWYHVDVTWDDPVGSNYFDYFGEVEHEYFLLSDDATALLHECYDAVVYSPCTDASFEGMSWTDWGYPFGFANGKTYMFDGEGISEFTVDGTKDELVYEYEPDRWNNRYFGSYDNRLIYSENNTFYAYDPANGTVSEVYTADIGTDKVIGFIVRGNTVRYAVNTRYSYDGNEKYFEYEMSPFITVQPAPVGDINDDGDIDGADYALLKRAVLRTYTLSEDALELADIDGNGAVDAFDYILLKRAVLGTYTI